MSSVVDHPVRHVSIGESAIGHGPLILEANLGSCLGIAIAWPAVRRFALAHVLLPQAPPGETRFSRYADSAPGFLLRRLEVPEDDRSELRAVIGGGGAMYALSPAAPAIGPKNVTTGRAALRRCRVRLLGEDVGADFPRRIRVNCDSGVVEVIRMMGDQATSMSWNLA